MATGCLSTPKLPEIDGHRHVRRGDLPHGHVAARRRRLHRPAGRRHRHRVVGHPGDPADRRAGRPPHRVPAHPGVLDSGAQRPARPGRSSPPARRPTRRYREQARTTHIGVVFDVARTTAPRRPIRPSASAASARVGTRGRCTASRSKFADILIDPAGQRAGGGVPAPADPRRRRRSRGRRARCRHGRFPYATKRPCLDTGYFETFNRPNVDARRRAGDADHRDQRRRHPHDRASSYDVDVIVFATGFDAVTGPLLAVNPVGRGGLTLREKWSAGPRTYLGLAIAGFPNLFLITGPGSPSVLTNVIVSIEHHVDWIADLLAAMGERGATTSRSRRDGRGRLGRSRHRDRRPDAVSRGPTRGTRVPTCPASRGCSCPTSAASAVSRASAPASPPTAIEGSS